MATKKKPEKNDADDDHEEAHGEETKPRNPWEKVKSLDELSELDYLKILLYGSSGAGKSEAAARFSRPLIGLTEHQAIPTIRLANPDAMVLPIKTVADIVDFTRLARHVSAREKFDAVVLDSLTDAQRIIREFYTKRQGDRAGSEKTSMESWGLTIDRTAKLARDLRDVRGMHVMLICLDDEAHIDGIGLVHRPGVSGKRLPNDLAQYVNLVGYIHKAETDNGLRHEVMFRGVDRYLTKGIKGLSDIEAPEPMWWAHQVLGHPVDPAVLDRVDGWRAQGDEDDGRDQ